MGPPWQETFRAPSATSPLPDRPATDPEPPTGSTTINRLDREKLDPELASAGRSESGFPEQNLQAERVLTPLARGRTPRNRDPRA